MSSYLNPNVAGGRNFNSGVSTPGLSALGIAQQVNPYGTARVSLEPQTIFHDSFEGTVIDVSKWTAGGTNVPTQSNGNAVLDLPATINLNSTLIGKSTFIPTLGFNMAAASLTLEAAQQTNPNVHRFFGLGQVTAYAIGTPLTDGAGFEVDITGAFNAVVYVAGTRYVINSTNTALITAQGSLPTGASSSTYGQTMAWPGNSHRVVIAIRSDLIYFYLDSLDVPVGVASFVQPQALNLPLRAASITAAASVLSTTFKIGACGVGDTAMASTIQLPSSNQWAAPFNATSTAYEASRVVKALPGNLFAISGYNSNVAAQFIQIFDSGTVPANGTAPACVYTVPASSNFNIDFGIYGRRFNTGIAICNSSTGPTKTLGAADCWFDARYM